MYVILTIWSRRFSLLCVPTDQRHYDPEREHNPEYDHEAFLGEEQAHEFDQLTPAESRRRLGLACTHSNI